MGGDARRRVAIVFTGGTIAMEPDPVAGGNRPVLGGAAILARAPEAARHADVVPIDWGLVPASHLSFNQLVDIAHVVSDQASSPAIDGVVVVQGTDSIEETALAYELLTGTDKPVVVTGAMRDASAADYDGPRNLADAVACAASQALRGVGAVVVLDGLIVAARDVVKTHATALDTFQPRDGEPVGTVVDGLVDVRRVPRPRRLPPVPRGAAVEDVHLVTAVVGMDGTLLRGLAARQPRGVVVAATGAGNTHPDLLAAASELMAAGTIVCLTTRCAHGTVTPAYAFPGGGATWQRAGAILSALDGPKTRVALALGLAAGLDRHAIAHLVAGDA